MSYTLTQTEYRQAKSRLTRVVNRGDAHAIKREAEAALALFAAKGFPDDWHRWEMASYDAEVKLQFERPW